MDDSFLKISTFSIEMGGCDVVVGVEWLKISIPITMDFKEIYMWFIDEGYKHTLKCLQVVH